MMQNKDVLVYHIFVELPLKDLIRMRQINKFFEGVIDKRMVMDRVIDCINGFWICSFGDDQSLRSY